MSTLTRPPAYPVLSDGRTTLRRLRTEDAQVFAEIHQDPLNVKFSGSVADMDADQASEFITGSIAAGWAAGTNLRFAILERMPKGEQVVGTLSLQEVYATTDGGSASVGIKMLPAGRGTGSAQRAIGLLCGYAFGNLGLGILHWLCTDGNQPSIALAQRCGFSLAAQIPGYGKANDQVSDASIFSQTAAQFAAAGQAADASQATVAGQTAGGTLAPSPALLVNTPVIPTLRNATVVLRELTMADAPQLVENCRNAEAVRWTTVPLDYSMEHAEYFIKTLTQQGWSNRDILTFAVAHPVTDTLLGTVDLQCKNPGTAAIGINFGAHARGTGAAEAAIRLLLDFAFNQLNLSYVHWNALVPNWGSRKLAWKLGFKFEGMIRGDYNDRGTASDRWILSLAAGDERTPMEPWTGPGPVSR
ncbi:GNAT family protein [Arthrobacter sp. TMP15]|uniref:GNAT family N-acetyltransferase n=1 Tax=Arthrobacter sp. TMP15 TaxID=3140789 RepID=UPI0031BABE7C